MRMNTRKGRGGALGEGEREVRLLSSESKVFMLPLSESEIFVLSLSKSKIFVLSLVHFCSLFRLSSQT